MFDFSPGCPTELCALSELDLFEMVDDVTIGRVIVPDGPYALKEFIDEHDISVPLLCDTVEWFAEAYAVLYEEKDGLDRVPKRAVFIIDSTGAIRVRWVAAANWAEWENEPFCRSK